MSQRKRCTIKILFINLPYYGHVVPTLGLVRELIRLGCDVTYLMPFGWEDRIAVSGAVFSGYPNHRQLSEQMKNAWAAAERIVDDFDFVIYEQFFFLAADPQIRKNLQTAQEWIAEAPGNRGGAEMILRFYRESART